MNNNDTHRVKRSFSAWLGEMREFLRGRFSLDEDKAQRDEVVAAISKGVVFRGVNLWVLIFATMIASLGLNVNSAAVIIGAMLISPIMGPIMGIGLSLGINDFELLKKALRNYALMFIVAIITSTVYFLVSPLSSNSSELLARKVPTTYDVLIALFGGLAGIVAQEMGVQIRITSGPAIEKPGALAALLTNLQEGDILFIDEIHRLSRQVEEVLYPALEDFALDIMIGKGPSAQSIRINLPRFTLVGATTRAGQLTGPLRDRFGILLKLEPYSPRELGRIILRSAGILGVPITEEGALELARCARGTPRIANRMLKRVRDYAQVRGNGPIELDICRQALEFFEIDELGLDWMDIRILETLAKTFSGRAVGLTTLASAVGEDPGTLEDVYEPYLLQCGLMIRTPQGRQATLRTFEHLGIEPTL